MKFGLWNQLRAKQEIIWRLDYLASLDDEQTENCRRRSEKVGVGLIWVVFWGRRCRVGAAGAGEFGMDNLKNPILGGWVGPVCEQLDFGAVRCTRQYRLVVSLLLLLLLLLRRSLFGSFRPSVVCPFPYMSTITIFVNLGLSLVSN